MATKKQKRAVALAKREAFMKEERERGLQAQRLGREEEKRKEARMKLEAQQINERFKTILESYGLGGLVK